MSYAVNRRRHEIGVRMAMGARAADVLRLVLGHAMRLALVGAVIGLAAALAASRLLTGLLHGVRPADPGAHAVSLVVVMAAALLAAFLPARRAAHGDPAAVLRHE
jgi:ABC-type antimicrobial peptide transport system permease subunit